MTLSGESNARAVVCDDPEDCPNAACPAACGWPPEPEPLSHEEIEELRWAAATDKARGYR